MPEQQFFNSERDYTQQVDDLRRRVAILERLTTTPTSRVVCRVRKNNNQTITANTIPLTAIAFNTSIEDDYSLWDGSTKIVVPEALNGRYFMAMLRVQWSTTSGSINDAGVFVRKNGTEVLSRGMWTVIPANTQETIMEPVALATDDYLEGCVYFSSSPGTVTITAGTQGTTGPYMPLLAAWVL